MKTTIEIADALLIEARNLAAQRHTTLRQLVEEGLRAVTNPQQRAGFKLQDASFDGKGTRLQGWDDIRKAIYEGRGE